MIALYIVGMVTALAIFAVVGWAWVSAAGRPKTGSNRIVQDPHTLKYGVEQYQGRHSIAGSFYFWRQVSEWFPTPDEAEAWLTAEKRRTVVVGKLGDQWIAVDGQ